MTPRSRSRFLSKRSRRGQQGRDRDRELRTTSLARRESNRKAVGLGHDDAVHRRHRGRRRRTLSRASEVLARYLLPRRPNVQRRSRPRLLRRTRSSPYAQHSMPKPSPRRFATPSTRWTPIFPSSGSYRSKRFSTRRSRDRASRRSCSRSSRVRDFSARRRRTLRRHGDDDGRSCARDRHSPRARLHPRPKAVATVWRRGATISAVGIGLGMAGAVATTRFMTSLLYGGRPTRSWNLRRRRGVSRVYRAPSGVCPCPRGREHRSRDHVATRLIAPCRPQRCQQRHCTRRSFRDINAGTCFLRSRGAARVSSSKITRPAIPRRRHSRRDCLRNRGARPRAPGPAPVSAHHGR